MIGIKKNYNSYFNSLKSLINKNFLFVIKDGLLTFLIALTIWARMLHISILGFDKGIYSFFFEKLLNFMQDHNSTNQEDLIFKLDQDRAWLLENLDKGKWSEIRSELADLERKISKLIIRVQESNIDN